VGHVTAPRLADPATAPGAGPAATPTEPVACRFCRGTTGDLVLDLGEQPSSELFPRVDDPGPDPLLRLRMWLCAGCGLAQLVGADGVAEEPLGAEPAALVRQRAAALERLVADGVLPAAGTVARGTVTEYPSPHGGTWLPELGRHGLTPVAGDGPADVVVDACFGMMHARDQRAAVAERAARLAPDGVLLLQYHCLGAIVDGLQWNALRHGHYAYYSTPALVGMLAEVGLTAVTAHRYPLYGGTVLLAATRAGAPDAALAEVVEQETATGVRAAAAVASLQGSVSRTADWLRATCAAHRAAGRRVYGYCAASRAVALLRVAGLDTSLLTAVADASPDKHGRRMPGTDIPIIAPDDLVAARPDVVLLFVSDLLDEVRAALPQVEAAGGSWVDAGAGR
jgi:C-methyltransferase C-terminal domain/Putative zinc binding domain/Methyltransferase domain